jgi:hypothetical protein
MTDAEIKAAADKAAADKAAKDLADAEAVKVVFDDKQQKKINDIIDARMGKAKGKHAEELTAAQEKIAELTAQLEEAAKAADPNDPEGKKKYKELIDAEKAKTTKADEKAKLNETKAKAAEARELNLRKETAMSRAMQKAAKFVDTADVMDLTNKYVTWNDELERFVVLGPDKKIRQNSSLDPMTLEEYFTDFAQKRPYLVNGDVKAGAGSEEAGGNVNVGTVHTKADLARSTPALTRKAKSDFIDKMGLEAFEALPLRA